MTTLPPRVPISVAVEGDVDDAVVRRLGLLSGVDIHEVLVRHGKPQILRVLPGFNRAAVTRAWYVLADLDQDARCPGDFVRQHLPAPSRYMRFRLAVRSVEAWLLADRAGFARFLGVPATRLPLWPELERDPKQLLVALARTSRKAIVRQGIPPRPRSGRPIGDLYQGLLIEFAREHWDVRIARRSARSLDRAIERLIELSTP